VVIDELRARVESVADNLVSIKADMMRSPANTPSKPIHFIDG
jgi:hypothetical protein